MLEFLTPSFFFFVCVCTLIQDLLFVFGADMNTEMIAVDQDELGVQASGVRQRVFTS